jgi:hypothetical protein
MTIVYSDVSFTQYTEQTADSLFLIWTTFCLTKINQVIIILLLN